MQTSKSHKYWIALQKFLICLFNKGPPVYLEMWRGSLNRNGDTVWQSGIWLILGLGPGLVPAGVCVWGGEDIMKTISFTSLCKTYWSVISATLGFQDGQNFQCATLLLGFHFLKFPICLSFYLFICYSCFQIS